MKVLNLTLVNWLALFAGSGLVGFALKLKGTQAWGTFLLAWILVGAIIHRVFGIQTQAGYYLGLQKDSVYPDIKSGLVTQ